jgi:predicted nucleic acid-binding Zn ribbon protein
VVLGLVPLAQLIKRPRFPFGHCSVCGKVFVRGKNQRYCSPVCMTRGVAAGRREERRPYMRRYMREYRAAQRARRQKEK